MNGTDKLKKRIAPILQKAGIRRSALFGSCARGTTKPDSDIDILAELPDNMTLLEYIGLKQELEDALGRPVDLVEYKSIKPRLRQSILADQVSIL